MEELRKKLFDKMRFDLCVMGEHGDSETSLWQELSQADIDILNEYAEIFLVAF